MSARPLLVDVVPTDVAAEQLGLRFDGPDPESLAELRLTHPRDADLSLHLAVIGASHVITVQAADETFREEVSCTARAAGQPLPAQLTRDGYRLRTRTLRLTDADFHRHANALLARATGPGALVVTFPGAGPHHLTALHGAATDTGWRWRTWHLYPDDGAVVETRSRWER